MSCVIKKAISKMQKHLNFEKQFIGEFISSLNSPEYIANQYTKLYFEGVSVFDMLDIVENITLDSINETSSLYLNLDQQVDSRLEIKK